MAAEDRTLDPVALAAERSADLRMAVAGFTVEHVREPDPLVWLLCYPEHPEQVYFTVARDGHWSNDRSAVPESVDDELFDEIICDDHRARGQTWRSREYTQ